MKKCVSDILCWIIDLSTELNSQIVIRYSYSYSFPEKLSFSIRSDRICYSSEFHPISWTPTSTFMEDWCECPLSTFKLILIFVGIYTIHSNENTWKRNTRLKCKDDNDDDDNGNKMHRPKRNEMNDHLLKTKQTECNKPRERWENGTKSLKA